MRNAIKAPKTTSQVVLEVNNLPANAGDSREAGSIPGLGRCPGERSVFYHSSILPAEVHGQGSLVGYSPWVCKKQDMTEHTHTC